MDVKLSSFGHVILGMLADGLVINPKSRATGGYSAELANLFADGKQNEIEILSATALSPIAKMTPNTSGGEYASGEFSLKFDCKIKVGETNYTTKIHACDVVAFALGNKTFTAQSGTIGDDKKPWLLLRNVSPATTAEVYQYLNTIKV